MSLLMWTMSQAGNLADRFQDKPRQMIWRIIENLENSWWVWQDETWRDPVDAIWRDRIWTTSNGGVSTSGEIVVRREEKDVVEDLVSGPRDKWHCGGGKNIRRLVCSHKIYNWFDDDLTIYLDYVTGGNYRGTDAPAVVKQLTGMRQVIGKARKAWKSEIDRTRNRRDEDVAQENARRGANGDDFLQRFFKHPAHDTDHASLHQFLSAERQSVDAGSGPVAVADTTVDTPTPFEPSERSSDDAAAASAATAAPQPQDHSMLEPQYHCSMLWPTPCWRNPPEYCYAENVRFSLCGEQMIPLPICSPEVSCPSGAWPGGIPMEPCEGGVVLPGAMFNLGQSQFSSGEAFFPCPLWSTMQRYEDCPYVGAAAYYPSYLPAMGGVGSSEHAFTSMPQEQQFFYAQEQQPFPAENQDQVLTSPSKLLLSSHAARAAWTEAPTVDGPGTDVEQTHSLTSGPGVGETIGSQSGGERGAVLPTSSMISSTTSTGEAGVNHEDVECNGSSTPFHWAPREEDHRSRPQAGASGGFGL